MIDGGKEYELVYGLKRIEMIEKAIGKSIVQAFQGVPGVGDLVTVCGYGMRESGKDAWVNPVQGIQAAERILEADGFKAMYEEVSNALMRDCGFLFQ